MKTKFERVSLLPPYVFAEINDLKAKERLKGRDVIDLGMGNPDNSADKVLEEIVKFKDEKKLRLVGHASKTGSETIEGKRINMEISISRAQTIKNMLINKGFDGNNIEVFGKGDLEPLQEAEEFGEAVNRRVEVFFISN